MSPTRNLAAVLLCFSGDTSAGKARKAIETRLGAGGDVVLQTSIVRVNAQRRASVYDPRRVMAGTLTAALTWGLFGLVAGSNKVESTVIWAVLGALCGGVYAYMAEHQLTKDELARIGKDLAPDSSALLMFVQTSDPERLLAATAASNPTTASLALIEADLTARVFAGSTSPVQVPERTSPGTVTADATAALSMLIVRYAEPKAAMRIAATLAKPPKGAAGHPGVELVIETTSDGRRRVTDPNRGTAAWARSDVISWGLFGLAFGAIVGYLGGGGLHGLVDGGVKTGLGWAIFGLFAGALYGLWAGRSISARRLKGIGPLLPDHTSAMLAWAIGSIRPEAVAPLVESGSVYVVIRFNATDGGAILEAG